MPAPAAPLSEEDYEIEDIEFHTLSQHKKTLVVKGYRWHCVGCKSSKKSKGAARACCQAKVAYTEAPDYLWYSQSKDELVEIEHMLPIHIKNAVLKLRLEKSKNPMFHLLGVLEAEASRRNMDI